MSRTLSASVFGQATLRTSRSAYTGSETPKRVQQSRDPLKVVDERSICASLRLAKPRYVLAWNATSNSAYFPLTPQEIGSASYEVHQAAARFIRVVREASREVGFVAESAEPLFRCVPT